MHGPADDRRQITATDVGGRYKLHAEAIDGVWSDCTTRYTDFWSYEDCGDTEVLQATFLDVHCNPVESCTWLGQGKPGSRYTYVDAHAPTLEIDMRVLVDEEAHDEHVSVSLQPPEIAPQVWLNVPLDFYEWRRSDFAALRDDQQLLGRSVVVCTGETPRSDEVDGHRTRMVSRAAAWLDDTELLPSRTAGQSLPVDCEVFTPDHAGLMRPKVLWLRSEVAAELAPIHAVEVLP